jgi:LysR family transcriptional regulator, hydrogen peroxide-inducible genes activator
MTPLPTLRQLRFFMALVRRQSFSKAADDCLVSQSTLSSAIKEMEGLLDQQLVDRSTRSFALTPAGELVAARAAEILASTEDMVRAARGRRPLEGAFYLGVIPTIAPFILPEATRRLHQAYPKLELYLREDLTASLAERLSAGLIDAALLAFPYEIPGADIEEIGEDPFWFACDSTHNLASKNEITTEDLKECELLLLEDGHCLREHAVDACHLAERKQAASFGGTSLFTLTQMIRSGLGATLLPEMAIKSGLAERAGLVAIPFAKPVPSRKIGIAWRKGSGRRDEAHAIAGVIKDIFWKA